MEKTKEQLKAEIDKLRMERIHLSTRLAVEMEGYFRGDESSVEAMASIRKEIEDIDVLLNPISLRYEKLFHHYIVTYITEMPDTLGKYMIKQTYTDLMRSEIDCQINTTQKTDLNKLPNYFDLIEDFGRQLLNRYTNASFQRIIKRD